MEAAVKEDEHNKATTDEAQKQTQHTVLDGS